MYSITHHCPGFTKSRSAVAALCLTLATVPALADNECDVPMQRWQSREAVQKHAVSQGWQVQRLKIDDGCYEIRGRDAQGRNFKAKLDPETLRVVEMKQRNGRDRNRRGRDRDRDRNRDRDRDHHRQDSDAQSQQPAPAPQSSPILTPGTAPRAQIE
ncbi:MAG: PepSY domain-containing protein [Burkholderiaceae bacterium]|nr:PepSY domain-containing protein [Burkholderiaceae bacterium]